MHDVLLIHPVAPPIMQHTTRALDGAGRLDALVTTFVDVERLVDARGRHNTRPVS